MSSNATVSSNSPSQFLHEFSACNNGNRTSNSMDTSLSMAMSFNWTVTETLQRSLIHLLTQSRDQISCCRTPVEWANETGLQTISLVVSTGFPQRLIGLNSWVRKWIETLKQRYFITSTILTQRFSVYPEGESSVRNIDQAVLYGTAQLSPISNIDPAVFCVITRHTFILQGAYLSCKAHIDLSLCKHADCGFQSG